MKKWSSLLGALLLSATLGACGGGGGGDDGGSSAVGGSSSSATSSSAASSASSDSSSSSSSSDSSASSSSNSSTAGSAVTLHMLGDSTMTFYAEDRRPQMGWGEAMQQFFDGNVTVKNWALGGRSSRSFYYEATRWPTILPQINAGDYVIIQFGHNDQKSGSDYAMYGTYAYCSDGSGNGEACSGAADAVNTAVDKAEHSYYQFLKRYVTEVRAKGAHPILMTPIVRNYQEGGDIRADGRHDFSAKTQGSEASPRGNYVQAMKDVATTYSVPLVDLTAETRSIVLGYGASAATSLYIAADSTHPQVLFANLIAKKAAEGMSSLDILKDNMVPVTSLIFSPGSLDWGNRYVGVPQTKSFMAAAFDLAPAAGTVTLSSPDAAFELSFDNSSWSQSLSIDYTNAAFTRTLYVRFTPSEAKNYAGNIAFMLGGSSIGSVALSGAGVAVGSGLDSNARWFTEGSKVSAIVDGLLVAADAAPHGDGLTAGSAKVVSINGQDTSVARYYANNWAARDESRYLEFTVTPTGKFSVESISGWFLASGTGNVKADIEYSADGQSWTKLNSSPDLARDTSASISEYTVTAEVAAGQSFKVRVYPWMVNADGGGRYLAVYDLKIAGKVSN